MAQLHINQFYLGRSIPISSTSTNFFNYKSIGLEDLLYISKNVHDYLSSSLSKNGTGFAKLMMLGILYLAKLTRNKLRSLSVRDIEDFVVDLSL